LRVLVNGEEVGTKERGCALCGATWGDYHEEVEGDELFFCCDMCAKEFRNMVQEVKRRKGWERVEELEIRGNYYTGRTCVARSRGRETKFYVRFGDDGEVETFRDVE